ncbi:MAG: succinate--CoA ligase subunit alpha [Desulfovibrio sp.]|jgi:succinyl-CoA synthetase alpha subunit|nr:succinate--CoA ligase subunit alpha [Desulfovibrio sp.]
MAILINAESRVIVQGITGRQARVHVPYHFEYGVRIVGGVTPGKGGERVSGVPVFDTVRGALERVGPVDGSIVFVPPQGVLDSALEAVDNGIKLLVIITEHVPVHDTMKIREAAKAAGCMVIGPNTIGVISPGKTKMGIMPGFLYREGHVGIVSRSGTLTHEAASCLAMRGIGQSSCVGIGGDPVPGTSFEGILEDFRHDPETEVVLLIGEIGGAAEERAARYLKETCYEKPVVVFIAGASSPPGKKMGHAGAIISGESGTVRSKHAALAGAKAHVVDTLEEAYVMIEKFLNKKK